MNIAPEYSLAVQAKITLALCVLHNFIRVHDPDDLMDDEELKVRDEALGRAAPRRTAEEYGHNITTEERDRASQVRDTIAKAMWEQYQTVLREHTETV
jgi:hypothetical protein